MSTYPMYPSKGLVVHLPDVAKGLVVHLPDVAEGLVVHLPDVAEGLVVHLPDVPEGLVVVPGNHPAVPLVEGVQRVVEVHHSQDGLVLIHAPSVLLTSTVESSIYFNFAQI